MSSDPPPRQHAHRAPPRFVLQDPRAEGDATVGTWTVPADLAYLDGHFPGMPIVPAAVVLEASLAFVRAVAQDATFLPRTARHAKFRRPIVPGETHVVRVTRGAAAWSVRWSDGVAEVVLDV